jgi:chromodomain-helicase-DNA-binding protein 1
VLTHFHFDRLLSKDTVEEDVLERAKKKMVLEHASELFFAQRLRPPSDRLAAFSSQSSTKSTLLEPRSDAAARPHPSPRTLAKMNSAPSSSEFLLDSPPLASLMTHIHVSTFRFGAQNIFKADDTAQGKKLDEMDLDDILNRAEDHETGVDAGGTSLGGEGFLQQFTAVQDFKADMSWDEIIPEDQRARIIDESQDQKPSADDGPSSMSLAPKKRSAASAPGKYTDMMDPGSPGDRSPSPQPEKPKKGKGSGAPRKTAAQRALELKGRSPSPLVPGCTS